MWWGLRHSLQRDAKAISHHYDVSNRFYEWLLGPTMAYTCAVFPGRRRPRGPGGAGRSGLPQARPGSPGNGLSGRRSTGDGDRWLSTPAGHYGVRVVGLFASQQAEYGRKRIAELGLSDVAEIRHDDYRHVYETGFDAVSSIGLTETHWGEEPARVHPVPRP